jgi:hypothetical protein
MTEVPEIIERLRQTINRGDTEGFLAFFPDDGVVEDWNRRFAGHAAIRKWSDKELIGAKGTLTITRVRSRTDTKVSLDADWASNFYTGPGHFEFTIEGDKIRNMRITES